MRREDLLAIQFNKLEFLITNRTGGFYRVFTSLSSFRRSNFQGARPLRQAKPGGRAASIDSAALVMVSFVEPSSAASLTEEVLPRLQFDHRFRWDKRSGFVPSWNA